MVINDVLWNSLFLSTPLVPSTGQYTQMFYLQKHFTAQKADFLCQSEFLICQYLKCIINIYNVSM